MTVARRSVVKSLFGSVALAAPAMMPGCAVSPAAEAIVKAAPYVPAADDQAELVRLGREFDRAEAVWIPLWREMRRTHDDWMAVAAKRGLTFRDDGIPALNTVSAEVGAEAASDANDHALTELEGIIDQINAIPPTSLAGLAVHAKVVRHWSVPLAIRERPVSEREEERTELLRFLAHLERLAS